MDIEERNERKMWAQRREEENRRKWIQGEIRVKKDKGQRFKLKKQKSQKLGANK